MKAQISTAAAQPGRKPAGVGEGGGVEAGADIGALVLAFMGSPQTAEWLDNATAERLLRAMPDANITSEQAGDFVRKVAEGFNAIRPHLDEVARQRGEELLDAHQRVRRASKIRNVATG